MYYGRRGYMPLDQSIVFDGGWRVLSGQVPFRDYHAPNGFAVHALQAAFFALFGVNWLAYCLHAAVVNGAFAVLVRGLLARMGLQGAAAWLWGALSALVLYPPFGVPYMDQHAFFFSFAAVALAVGARRAERRGGGPRAAAWIALPPVLLLAGLSKQIPSAFAVPLVLAVAFADRPADALRRLRGLALGTGACAALLALAVPALGMDLERIDTYFRRLPAEEGARRYAYLTEGLLERMRHTGELLGLRTVGAVHAAAALALLGHALAPLWRGRARERLLAPLRAALLGEALLAICLLFIALTSNQREIGVPFVFAAGGLVHAALERARDSLLRARRVWLAAWPRLAGLLLAAVAAADGWRFTSSVNATRTVNDIDWDPWAAGLAAPLVPRGLDFLCWQVPPSVPYGAAELRDVLEFLREADAPFLWFGDASIAYGLAGQPSAFPALWFHPGLTLPLAGDPRAAEFEELVLERIAALGVRYVVLEGEHTWIRRLTLADFPRLQALVEARRVASERFGPFEVIDLGA
jgi:hypothetical protein